MTARPLHDHLSRRRDSTSPTGTPRCSSRPTRTSSCGSASTCSTRRRHCGICGRDWAPPPPPGHCRPGDRHRPVPRTRPGSSPHGSHHRPGAPARLGAAGRPLRRRRAGRQRRRAAPVARRDRPRDAARLRPRRLRARAGRRGRRQSRPHLRPAAAPPERGAAPAQRLRPLQLGLPLRPAAPLPAHPGRGRARRLVPGHAGLAARRPLGLRAAGRDGLPAARRQHGAGRAPVRRPPDRRGHRLACATTSASCSLTDWTARDPSRLDRANARRLPMSRPSTNASCCNRPRSRATSRPSTPSTCRRCGGRAWPIARLRHMWSHPRREA